MWSTSIATLATSAATTKGSGSRRPEIATRARRRIRQRARGGGRRAMRPPSARVEPRKGIQSGHRQTTAPPGANPGGAGRARWCARGEMMASPAAGDGYRDLSEAPLEVAELLVQLVRQ